MYAFKNATVATSSSEGARGDCAVWRRRFGELYGKRITRIRENRPPGTSKIHESLLVREELPPLPRSREDYTASRQVRRDLNYAKFVEQGESGSPVGDYTSHNTRS